MMLQYLTCVSNAAQHALHLTRAFGDPLYHGFFAFADGLFSEWWSCKSGAGR